MVTDTKSIIKFLTGFIVAFGATSLIPTQVITMERYVFVILFLILCSVALIFFFNKIYKSLVLKTRWYEVLGLIGVSLCVHGLVSLYILTYLDRPDWPFTDKGVSFLLMNSYYVWAKPFDVLVQQLLISALVLKLASFGLSIRKITGLLVVCFGFIHIFQTLKTDPVIGIVFTVGGVVLASLFPYLLLKARNGYLYNYMIQLGIYNLVAVLAWTLY